MKTTTSLKLALAAMFALGASAFADQQPNQQPLAKARMSGAKAPMESTSKSWDNQPNVLRTAGSSSMTFIKKTGSSISRTPQIVSETFSGKRNLVSKHGIMTEREMKKTGGKVPSAPSQSVANHRG